MIPENIKYIGEFAFSGCDSVETIIVDENNENYDSRENSNAIIDKNYNSLKFGCKNTVIPHSIDVIDKSAFCELSSLESITIPNNITDIRSYAFYECKGLKNIVLSDNLKFIAGSTFAYCESLESIEIPESVKSIANVAFLDCSSLKKITLKKEIPYFFSFAFDNTNIETIIYLGTEKEWNKQVISRNLNLSKIFNESLKTIKCVDGDILC